MLMAQGTFVYVCDPGLREYLRPCKADSMAKPQHSKRHKSLGERSRQRELTPEARDELAQKMCRGKKRFALQSEARMAADEHGLGIYRCPVCRGWHLTSKRDA